MLFTHIAPRLVPSSIHESWDIERLVANEVGDFGTEPLDQAFRRRAVPGDQQRHIGHLTAFVAAL